MMLKSIFTAIVRFFRQSVVFGKDGQMIRIGHPGFPDVAMAPPGRGARIVINDPSGDMTQWINETAKI